jgi:hypothetical protein
MIERPQNNAVPSNNIQEQSCDDRMKHTSFIILSNVSISLLLQYESALLGSFPVYNKIYEFLRSYPLKLNGKYMYQPLQQ